MTEPHRVVVGGAPIEVSEVEYFLATLPNDTPIEWGGGRDLGPTSFPVPEPTEGCGILLYTWFYDGVVAEVLCGHRRVTLFLSHHTDLWVRRLDDLSRLDVPGTHGDGI